MKRILLVMLCGLTLFGAASGNAPGTKATPEEKAASVTLAFAKTEETPALQTIQLAASKPVDKPAAEAAEEPAEPAATKITVLAGGDLMCLASQLRAARRNGAYEFGYCFEKIKDKVSAADFAIGNFETLVADGYPYTGPSPKKGNPRLNAPESYLRAVVGCGFDALINANNHIFDKKTDGTDKTINKIDEYGVYHTGAFATGEQRGPLVVDVKGIKLGILGYTDHLNGGGRGTGMINMYSEELVASDIAAAKAQGADYIIVYIHWGKENTHKVTKTQKNMAAFIANSGADIIIGSHPHCTQGTDSIQTTHGVVPVFYSLGNLISSMGRTINKDSLLVNMTLEKDNVTGETKLTALTYTPTLCGSTEAGSYVVLPADLGSIAQSAKPKPLMASRARTIKVLGNAVAKPE